MELKDKVLVKNAGRETYEEEFKEVKYTIKPGETIEMNRLQASKFLQSFPGKDNTTGRLKIKNLEIVELPKKLISQKQGV